MFPALSQDTRDIVVATLVGHSGTFKGIRSMSVSDNPLKFHLKLGNNSIGGQHLEEAIFSAAT